MSLPVERRAINGRTWSSMYRETDYAPIQRHDAGSELGHATATILCVLILIGFALYLAAAWGSM